MEYSWRLLTLIGFFILNQTNINAQCEVQGGQLTGGPFEFCVDGQADLVSGVDIQGQVGTNSAWVITDAEGQILGLPPMPGVVDFDAAGTGVCFIYHLSYDDVEGLEMGNTLTDLSGCYALSNSLSVVRSSSSAQCDPQNCDITAGVLTGGPFDFCVDGSSDFVSDITLEGSSGENHAYVITDGAGIILGLPPMPSVVDFDGAGVGTCLIWNISYNGSIDALNLGSNIFTDLTGCHSISNAIIVNRNEQPEGGTLEGGPFEFCVDGIADMVSGITLTGNSGTQNSWLITDEDGNILGLPPMPGVVDFDGAGPGVCLIWNISYNGVLEGLEMNNNVSDLMGCYGLSNAVTVVRNQPMGGILEGGPFEFCVDGIPDFVSGIELTDNTGGNNQWLITDEAGNILGLPPMPGVVDFDAAGGGICLIWNISYDGDLVGLEVNNNVADLEGCYGISNSITVTRNAEIGGVLAGGPFEFCVDGTPDMVSNINLSGQSGQNMAWIITDAAGKILGLPPMPEVVDFDGTGAGICQIWHISYSDGLEGLVMDNYLTDLTGCYDLSNEISVIRTDGGAACDASCDNVGGILTGGPFEFCVDGVADMVSGIDLEGNSGTNNQWVITDEAGNILGLPPMPGVVDFDEAGAGICLIWNVSYEDGLLGLAGDSNLFTDLEGCYSISNPVTVIRQTADGGMVSLADGSTEYSNCAGDIIFDVMHETSATSLSYWYIITDADDNILDWHNSANGSTLNLSGAPAGECHVWGWSYQGLGDPVVGEHISTLADDACEAISDNWITIYRETPDGGMVSLADGTTSYSNCAGDIVFDMMHETMAPNLSYWYIITDADDTILAWHNSVDGPTIDISGAPAGECHIWGWNYKGLDDPIVGEHISSLNDDFCESISDNWVTIFRETPDGGMVSLADGTTSYSNCAGDIIFDMMHETMAPNLSYWYIITDADDTILAWHNAADGPTIDISGAPAGECHIWGWNYKGLDDPIMGEHISTLADDFCEDISDNWVSIFREEPDGGSISLADGSMSYSNCAGDIVFDVMHETMAPNLSYWYIITDADDNILAWHNSADGPTIDISAAPAGECHIWGWNYKGLDDPIIGEHISTLDDDFCESISEAWITIFREEPDGGMIQLVGGATTYEGIAGDIVIDVEHETTAPNLSYWYIITDDNDNIITWQNSTNGGTLDLSGAPVGVCHIWGWNYKGLDDPIVGDNIATLADDFCEDISDNWITVTRSACEAQGGTLEGGPFVFCVDEEADFVSGISLTENEGSNNQWVITDESGIILGLPPMPGVVDFNEAGPGVCLIWNVAYEDGIEGLEMGLAIDSLFGCYAVSNAIVVTRNQVDGGQLVGGPYEFCVDNEADFVTDLALNDAIGANTQWVVTDEDGMILGLPANIEDVDFNEAGAGVCLIWNVSFADGLEGAEVGMNANDLVGCFSLSNPITVNRVTEGSVCTTATEEEAFFSFVQVYPNPAIHQLQISYEMQQTLGQGQVSLINAQGQTVLSKPLNQRTDTLEINLETIASGTYFVRFTFDQESIYKRVIVLK